MSCSAATLGRLDGAGTAASLLIDTHVREDAIQLYGFLDAAEQEWFRLLHSVQGVGAKAALAILSVCPADRIGFAIASGDKAAITRADGVGPKLAARILTELKDKAAKMDLSPAAGKAALRPAPEAGQPAALAQPGGAEEDAVSALVNLGYGRSDAYQAVLRAREQDNDADLGRLIQGALKALSA